MRRLFTLLVVVAVACTTLQGAVLDQVTKAIDRGQYDKALSKLQPLADRGDAEAQNFLASLYYHGIGVDQDFELAALWFRRAAESDHAAAQYNLAMMLTEGEGVERDYTEAFRWMLASAEQDEGEAVNRVASRYARGRGVERNHATAVEWYRRAAEEGDANAQYQVGFAYQWGHGVERDPRKAEEWFNKAVAQGHVAARNRQPASRLEAAGRSRFEHVDCWFEVREGRDAICGRMHVPERRDEPNASMTHFPVVVYRTNWFEPKPFPVLVLARGGPGGAALLDEEWLDEYWDTYDWQFLSEGRDVIVVDQRGAGLSEPRLDCPETIPLAEGLLSRSVTAEEEAAVLAGAFARCRQRLLDAGIDISAYDSAASAADIEEMRNALGYEQWDLYGASYSGRLALTVARDFPHGVRAMILDSPAAPDTRLAEEFAFVHESFATLFSACAEDGACSTRFPDVRTTLEHLFDVFEVEPLQLVVTHPRTLEPFTMVVDGDRLVEILFWSMYSESGIDGIPLAITAAGNGSYDLLVPFARRALDEYIDEDWSGGQNLSVSCRENLPFDDFDAAREVARRDPLFAGLLNSWLLTYESGCAAWDPGASDAREGEAVTSEIPTLILSGRFDPVTRTSEAQRILKTLPNAFHYEFPAMAHGIMESEFCAEKAIVAFLDAPDKNPFRINCIQDLEPLEFAREP